MHIHLFTRLVPGLHRHCRWWFLFVPLGSRFTPIVQHTPLHVVVFSSLAYVTNVTQRFTPSTQHTPLQVVVVGDDVEAIGREVRALSAGHDIVITAGGLGERRHSGQAGQPTAGMQCSNTPTPQNSPKSAMPPSM